MIHQINRFYYLILLNYVFKTKIYFMYRNIKLVELKVEKGEVLN